MTREQLTARFPNASEDFLRRNASDGGARSIPNRYTGPAAVVERNPRDGALGALPVQKATGGLFLVRVTAFRCRLLDEDNLAEKYHVDLCRYAGVLPSDAAGKAKITTSQEKVRTEAEERVEIVVSRVAPAQEQLLLDESNANP